MRRWRLYTSDGEDIGIFSTARSKRSIGDKLTDENGTRFRVLDVSGFENQLDDPGLGEFMPTSEFAGALVVTPLEPAEPR